MDEILTVKEIAEYLKVKPVTIYKMCKEGKLPALKIGACWRIKKNLLVKWMDEKSYPLLIMEVKK